MTRSVSILLIAALTFVSGCGGDDTTASSTTSAAPGSSADSTPQSDSSTTNVATSAAVTAPSTVPVPTAPPEECETTPDIANYEAPIPIVARPCELPSELVSTTVIEGSGKPAETGDSVFVHYVGVRSEDGEVFDASYRRDAPIEVVLGEGRVIAGWDQGLVGIKVGEVRRLDIPAELAYGDSPPGPPIEAGDALTFVVKAVGISHATTIDDAPLDIQVHESTDATETTVDVRTVGDGSEVPVDGTAIIHIMLVRGDDLTIAFNSWETNEPWSVDTGNGESLPGLIQGLKGAHVGDRRVITMPPEQAFGEQGVPDVGLPAGVDVIAVVDVIGTY